MIKEEFFTLSNGVHIPKIGFGTWQIADGNEAYQSTLWALEAGYRHIDTAYDYTNEKDIGRAIQDSGIERKDLFITTKLPSHIKTYQGCKDYFASSASSLGLDYIDLYLIHAPWPWSNIGQDCHEGNIAAWKAMVELYKTGKIRAIGVSNFQPTDIDYLVRATDFIPHVNQIRYFIGNTEKNVVDYCCKNNILVEAYSPLATGKILKDKTIEKIALKYKTSIAKICLRFCLQNNTLPLPKSSHRERIIDNLDVDFEIDGSDMDYLNSLVNSALKSPLRS